MDVGHGAPDVPNAVPGWRAWTLGRSDALEPQLVSPVERSVWPAGRAAIARCMEVATHEPPAPGCGCGLYAVTDPGRMMGIKPGRGVIGIVALWGDVLEGTHGWRATHGYPRLLVADPGTGHRAFTRLGDRYAVPLHRSEIPLPQLVGLLATELRDLADGLLRGATTWPELAVAVRAFRRPAV